MGVQVLSTVPVMFSYWAKPEDGLDLARFLNDHLAERGAQRSPRRFAGLGTLPMQAPELAVRELERCVRELGLAGVQIGSHVNDWNLDDPELFPVFEAAAELGAAVFVHPWDMLGAGADGEVLAAVAGGHAGRGVAVAICSMIFGGVLERLPKLRVAFAHGGGAFPGTLGRIQHGFEARPDLWPSTTRCRPRDYLGRFYVDSLVHDADALRLIVELFGAERVALGTRLPVSRWARTCPGTLIESMPELDAAHARAAAARATRSSGWAAGQRLRPRDARPVTSRLHSEKPHDSLRRDDATGRARTRSRRFRERVPLPQRPGRRGRALLRGQLARAPAAQGARSTSMQELDDWARLGRRGPLRTRGNPWLPYHELLTGTTARLVGALPLEVVVMNTLTVNLHLMMVSFYRPTPRALQDPHRGRRLPVGPVRRGLAGALPRL